MADVSLDWLENLLKTQMSHLKGESGRLLHGRGGAFPGFEEVILDVYPPLMLIVTFGEKGAAMVPQLAAMLVKIAENQGLTRDKGFCLMHQHRRGKDITWETLFGMSTGTIRTTYKGARFVLKTGSRQNIGLFVDMAQGHGLVQRLAGGKRILNLFAYTCAFSVLALQAGGKQVVNVDINKGALNQGRENHRMNEIAGNKAVFLPHNVMKSFGNMRKRGPFDLVILDPPTRQPPSFDAEVDYPKMIRRLPELLVPGGEIIACLNAPHLDRAQFKSWFDEGVFTFHEMLGRPTSFREKDPDCDLKIGHFILKS